MSTACHSRVHDPGPVDLLPAGPEEPERCGESCARNGMSEAERRDEYDESPAAVYRLLNAEDGSHHRVVGGVGDRFLTDA